MSLKRKNSSSALAVNNPSKIKLQANDGTEFEVETKLARQSELIKKLMEEWDFGNDNIVYFPDVSGPTMASLVQIWHLKRSKRLRTGYFEKAKVRDVEQVMDLAIAANYLDCDELIEATRKMVEDIAPCDAADYFELRDGTDYVC